MASKKLLTVVALLAASAAAFPAAVTKRSPSSVNCLQGTSPNPNSVSTDGSDTCICDDPNAGMQLLIKIVTSTTYVIDVTCPFCKWATNLGRNLPKNGAGLCGCPLPNTELVANNPARPYEYNCACVEGFAGDGISKCDDLCPGTEREYSKVTKGCVCSAGFVGDGEKCDPIAVCDKIGQELDTQNNKCICSAGFVGDGTTCEEIAVCDGEGQVLDTENNKCICGDKFIGDGTTCTAIAVCEGLGQELDRQNNKCICGSNFIGDETGTTCTPIAVCNGVGQELDSQNNKCICKEDFTGDGTTCTPVVPNPVCNGVGQELDVKNSVCICSTGYEGDGKTCTLKATYSDDNNGDYEDSYDNSKDTYTKDGNNDSYDDKTKLKCPAQSYLSGSTCVCTCQNSQYDADSNSCVCKGGYEKNSKGNCEKRQKTSISYDGKDEKSYEKEEKY